MKKILHFLRLLIPHLCLIISLALLTFFVIDLFNESMAFLNNSITKALLCADAVLTVALSLIVIVGDSNRR